MCWVSFPTYRENSHYSGNVEVSAFLQAETSNNGLSELGNNLISDGTIGHDRVVKNSIIQNEWLPLVRSISENGISQVSLTEIGKFNVTGIDQIGSSQIGSDELSLIQKSPVQVSTTQISPIKESLLQTSTTQISSTQVSPTPILLGKIGVNKDGSLQIGSCNLTFSPEDTITKVSFPSSVTFQQLFITHLDSSHSPNLQNTTVPTWTEFLQSPTPFNLKIEVTDLPTGQLAEATITGYDTNVTQIQVINQPTHGTLTQTPDGKLTYQPVSTYVGNDSFTYLGFGSDGQISNLATVNLTINNLPPTIQRIDIPTNIKEGAITTLTATATDIGNDPLTYRWYINGATTALERRSIAVCLSLQR
jgi:hypothetical protein